MSFISPFVFCILVRFSFVLIAKYIKKDYLPYLGAIALVPALGFIVIYLGDYRKTGMEVGGGRIWWNALRPVHGCLYLLFALLALKKQRKAWIPLLIDVCLGLFAFLAHRYG